MTPRSTAAAISLRGVGRSAILRQANAVMLGVAAIVGAGLAGPLRAAGAGCGGAHAMTKRTRASGRRITPIYRVDAGRGDHRARGTRRILPFGTPRDRRRARAHAAPPLPARARRRRRHPGEDHHRADDRPGDLWWPPRSA